MSPLVIERAILCGIAPVGAPCKLALDNTGMSHGNSGLQREKVSPVSATSTDIEPIESLLEQEPLQDESTASNFLRCVFQGDAQTVLQMLHEDESRVNAKDSGGKTALHWACLKGNFEMANLLLKWGASPNCVDTATYTPLIISVMRGDALILERLISYGGSVHATIGKNMTALHWASVKNSNEVVKVLINAGGQVNAENSKGATPLHCAAESSSIECAQQLLAAGCEINYPDNTFQSPLFYAVSYAKLHTSANSQL